MATAPFLRLMRELASCYQALEALSAADIRRHGLTPAQFDVIATLGNTEGMTPTELGTRTLITKGTLTGVVDRLAGKGLLQRLPSPVDGRSQILRLSRDGEALFARIFPAHVAYLADAFTGLGPEDYARAERELRALRERFRAALEAA